RLAPTKLKAPERTVPKENSSETPTPGYRRAPLYLQILVALVPGVLAGLALPRGSAAGFNIPAQMILRMLGAIAPPLILLAVMRALIGTDVRGRMAGRMFSILALNTVVAIGIGLLIANLVGPGRHASLPPGEPPTLGRDA